MSFSDNIVVIEDGRIVEQGPTYQLLQSSSYLGKAGVVSTASEESSDTDIEAEATALVVSRNEDTDHHVQDLRRSTGDFRIYGYYIRSGGYIAIMIYTICIIIWTFGTEVSSESLRNFTAAYG